MAIILKANKGNLFVFSVLFVLWYHSPKFLDTPRIMQCMVFGRWRLWWHGTAECSIVARGGCCLGLQCDKVNRTYGVGVKKTKRDAGAALVTHSSPTV
jgi:hypothetical protein